MAKSLLKTRTSDTAPFRSEFWEIWLLVLVLVTIFGLFAQSQNKIQLSNALLEQRIDLYDLRAETPRGARAVETGF